MNQGSPSCFRSLAFAPKRRTDISPPFTPASSCFYSSAPAPERGGRRRSQIGIHVRAARLFGWTRATMMQAKTRKLHHADFSPAMLLRKGVVYYQLRTTLKYLQRRAVSTAALWGNLPRRQRHPRAMKLHAFGKAKYFDASGCNRG